MNLTYQLSLSSAGRLLLHAGCMVRRPSHAQWHWQGICRELALTRTSAKAVIVLLLVLFAARASMGTIISPEVGEFDAWSYSLILSPGRPFCHSTANLNDGQHHLINFSWAATEHKRSGTFVVIQVADSPFGIEVLDDRPWYLRGPAKLRNLCVGSIHPNGSHVNWSLVILSDWSVALLYDGPSLNGRLIARVPLDPGQPWYVWFTSTDFKPVGTFAFRDNYSCLDRIDIRTLPRSFCERVFGPAPAIRCQTLSVPPPKDSHIDTFGEEHGGPTEPLPFFSLVD